MNRSEAIVTIIAAGSLWGLFEIVPMPTGILCAIGIFFLVLARKMVNLPGTSTLIGAIVCLFKMYSSHFMMCQTAGVMTLAVSFDLFALLFWNSETNKFLNMSRIVVAANVLALPVFLLWVNFVAPLSYWTAGGWDRALWYATSSVLPAILLGIVTGNAALLLAERTAVRKEPGIPASGIPASGIPALAMRAMLPTAVIAWSIASVVKFL